ncbi:MAG: hypothetical protein M0P72_10020 [Metallibacterium scheffleri]|uniref:hypothetical protein n=1 Tax=Metallibacterium scheffleri TaxID=993689 RepID=UPI0026F02FFE|nr:hypothetical protein [Metallibacterium scheffleri]MCK9367468.1 hypothetical protein [Metallibacterium scheffleri]
MRHRHHMRHALASIAPRRPLSAATLADLDDDAVQDIDQFVLRFGKLQDVLGTRLFPALLDVLQEPYEDRPMLDKLNRLEKLGLLESTEAWEKLRALRNHFAHEYPDEPALRAAYLNQGFDAAASIETILQRIGQRFGLGLE